MRSLAITAVTALLAGCAGSPSSPARFEFSSAANRGLALAQQRCSGCHTIGLDETSATEGPRFRDLQMRYNTLSLEKKFREVAQHGTGEMPPVGISSPDAEDLIAYFETLDRRY
jgi:mono/diheme cytochrome c family protein